MKITLEIVRDVLRNSLGRDSFVGAVITKVIEDPNCATACITADGLMRYGSEFTRTFVTDHCDLFCLVMHELMHPLFGHFVFSSGPLENIAADMVINASISQFFANESGQGSLFTKFYERRGLQGLLRPQSQMRESRYESLYDAFYRRDRNRNHFLSTGEVIQTLKVLTPTAEVTKVSLLGSHSAANDRQELSSESLSRIAEDMKKAIGRRRGSNAGYNESLFDVLVDVLNTKLTLKKAMLKRFATKQKLDHFRHFAQQRRTTVSPMPINPSKRDIVLLSSGITPFHYRNKTVHSTEEKQGIAIYVDVSGSVNEYLPRIVGLLQTLRREIKSIFLFSNRAIEVPLQSLLSGAIKTTYGTDFNCIAESILSRGFEKAVVMTDGYASLSGEVLDQLEQRKVLTLTVLFGGKTECPEFEHLGDVIQLDEIVQ